MTIHDKDAEIIALQATIAEKAVEIVALKTALVEKDAELSRLLIQDIEPIDINLSDVFNKENAKLCEDLGNEEFATDCDDGDFVQPPAKKKKPYQHGPRVVLSDGKVSRRRPGARAYKSRKERVLNFPVVDALNHIFDNKDAFIRLPGQGHDYEGVRYAQFYGHLRRGSEPVLLKTFVLSSDKKVYQMISPGEYYELQWQNDKDVFNPSYGTIKFPIEGDSTQISLKTPFLRELGVEL